MTLFTQGTKLGHVSVLKVSGKDAVKFLNGVTTNKIPEAGPSKVLSRIASWHAVLNAQGRILHDVHIHPLPTEAPQPFPTYLLTASSLNPTPILPLFKKFVLRSKVSLTDVSNEWDAWALWGANANQSGLSIREWKWGSGGIEPLYSENDAGEDEDLRKYVGGWDMRTPDMGWRGLVRKDEKPPGLAPSFNPVTEEIYRRHRITQGVAEGPKELIPGSSLPIESNMDIMGGIDFHKGCYVGQELTIRTFHTGITRKRILPIKLYPTTTSSIPPPLLPAQSSISYRPSNPSPTAPKRPKSAGKILNTYWDSESGIARGLALVRLEMCEGHLSVQATAEEGGLEWAIEPAIENMGWWPVKGDTNIETRIGNEGDE